MMSTLWLAACITGLVSSFSVETIPLSSSDAHCFVADTGNDAVADVFVLDGYKLYVYENGLLQWAFSITLPKETSAFDIADITGDGTNELVVVAGDQILKYDLEPDLTGEPVLLFKQKTQFSTYHSHPFLHVLVIHRGDDVVLALPGDQQLELRTVTGELQDQFSVGIDAPHYMSIGDPFLAWPVSGGRLGPDNAFEFHVSRLLALKPRLPEELVPAKVRAPIAWRGTSLQAWDVALKGAEYWPWFRLQTQGDSKSKVLFSRTGSGVGETRIRLQQYEDSDKNGNDANTLSPVRRYPGGLLQGSKALPDFNKDGYVDLLMWNAPPPAPSMGRITRAVMEGTWPIWLSIHYFSPDKNRFLAAPVSSIALEVPWSWYLMGLHSDDPVRNLVLADINNDGQTDVGCSLAPSRFEIRFSVEDGLQKNPDFKHEFPEPIRSVAFAESLGESGYASIGLRSENYLYIIHPLASMY